MRLVQLSKEGIADEERLATAGLSHLNQLGVENQSRSSVAIHQRCVVLKQPYRLNEFLLRPQPPAA